MTPPPLFIRTGALRTRARAGRVLVRPGEHTEQLRAALLDLVIGCGTRPLFVRRCPRLLGTEGVHLPWSPDRISGRRGAPKVTSSAGRSALLDPRHRG
jgi:hypothetical protein